MTRLFFSTVTFLMVGGAVLAVVPAQEASETRHPDSSSVVSGVAEGRNSQGVRSTQYLHSAGRAVAAEYRQDLGSKAAPSSPGGWRAPSETIMLVAASEDEPTGGLRSVLTRKSTLADASRQPAAPPQTRLDPPSPMSSEQDTLAEGETELSRNQQPVLEESVSEEQSSVLDAPSSLAPSFPAQAAASPFAPLDPPAASSSGEPAVGEFSSGDGAHASSRRTYRDLPGGPQPPSMVTRSVAPSRTLASQESSGGTASGDTLNSSTGALLRVDTTGPEAIIIGEVADLSVRLSNLGVTDAQRANVRITIPRNLELVSSEVEDGTAGVQQETSSGSVLVWTIDRIAARAERRMTLRVIPRTATPLELPVEWSVAPISTIARIEVQQPRLELALQGPSELVYGDTQVFTVTVSNPGNGDARQVALRLTLGEDSTDNLQIGTVAAGVSRKYEVEVTARQAGPMTIMAVVQGANELRAEAQEQIQVRRADLKLETAGSGMQFAGSVGTYQVRVINQGDAAAEQLKATVRLPSSAKYVEGLENAEQLGNELTWAVGRLAAGEERTYRFFCQLNQAGEARFDMAVRNEGGLETSSSVVTRVESIADLKMTINDPTSPIPVGEEVLYEIQIVNRGTKAAEQVQVIAQFSDGIEPVAVEGSPAELMPGQAVFQPLARVNPGETITLKVKARADRDGNHIFRAELRCSDPEYRLVAEDTTTFYDTELLGSSVESTTVSPSNAPAGNPAHTSRRGAGSIGR